MLSASQLADQLGVSRARVSQFVSEGKLDGCFEGAGRDRRFDPEKVAQALGRKLHPGQMLGNGRATRAAIERISEGLDDDAAPARPDRSRYDGPLHLRDPDRYELARIQKAEEEARMLRRRNQEAEGTLVLASEAARQSARLIAQEVAEFEAVLRDGARRVADELGVDFKRVRALLTQIWRAHRQARSDQLAHQAETAQPTEAERGEDF